jgi:hypothetical protein
LDTLPSINYLTLQDNDTGKPLILSLSYKGIKSSENTTSMDRDTIQRDLRDLYETIGEQVELMIREEGNIPLIEFDLIMDNVRKFYEGLHQLRKDQEQPGSLPEPVTTGAVPESGQIQPFAEPAETGNPEHDGSPVQQLSGETEKVEPSASNSGDHGELELFMEEETAFENRLKEVREKSLPKKPETGVHLKTMIGINDKFMMINELFDGNLRDYNEAIETLNGFDILRDALNYLDLLRRKNIWEMKSGTVMKLKEIIEKKFANLQR